METETVLEELKGIMVERLKFDPRRASELTLDTVLPKGLEGSLGLDSLDFIEMSIAIEERFGFVIDESQDLEPHFQSLGTLVKYIASRMADR
ncbi:MAG TPA: acyl carrier protein [Methylomirabilota bacterium]|nr:acyl carrier protein [Methylomirabilota bacterium]